MWFSCRFGGYLTCAFVWGKMQLMDFKKWIEGLPGAPLVTQAAERAGIDRSTISRQLKRGSVSAENVIALARAHGASPADALVETGYLEPGELDGAGVPEALGHATNQQLLDEIHRRVDPEAMRLLRGGGGGISPKFKPVPVPDIPAAPPLPDEVYLAARRTNEPKGADPRGLDDGEE